MSEHDLSALNGDTVNGVETDEAQQSYLRLDFESGRALVVTVDVDGQLAVEYEEPDAEA